MSPTGEWSHWSDSSSMPCCRDIDLLIQTPNSYQFIKIYRIILILPIVSKNDTTRKFVIIGHGQSGKYKRSGKPGLSSDKRYSADRSFINGEQTMQI